MRWEPVPIGGHPNRHLGRPMTTRFSLPESLTAPRHVEGARPLVPRPGLESCLGDRPAGLTRETDVLPTALGSALQAVET